ncbi:pyridoxamine 5'-phosphate oxidase [Aurantibacillus circumpalustris]|uniref:pyridoxamine 5'-phosphate oxidase n=1 Tax=Aurantibacillus circumpalustris TaxID=3036359 RepID=UPI00295BCCE4|nr:pyridoxamine 5'-phosphate oxidase [Aurantibacillus circumpalustris]
MDELKNHITKLREDFTKGTLSEADVSTDPFLQFTYWLQQAVDSKIPEVQAANLATVSSEGKPSSRIVYLREFEKNNFSFYTNYNSRKAKDLEQNPHTCLTFFWPELERQVRIEGKVEKTSAAQSDAYFNARPYDSKVGAWSSEQSNLLFSRGELEIKIEEIKKLYNPETIKRPDFWGGYILKANYYEFWQGRKSRLHDRISYRLQNNNWLISRLSP